MQTLNTLEKEMLSEAKKAQKLLEEQRQKSLEALSDPRKRSQFIKKKLAQYNLSFCTVLFATLL